jgi:hypothetical protein
MPSWFRLSVSSVFIGIMWCASLHSQVPTASCVFKTFRLNPSNPNNPGSDARGVNDNRAVVGIANYAVNKTSWGFVHHSIGTITYWHPPNAKGSGLVGRNNLGNTVGDYVDTLGIAHAAYLHGSTTTLIVHPKAVHHSTALVGINNLNTLLGGYTGSDGKNHWFKRRSNGTFLDIPNFPGANTTDAHGFNDNGVVVGRYTYSGTDSQGFIYRNGAFATLNFNNNKTGSYTELIGISNNGVIVGLDYGEAFLYKNGVFKWIKPPNSRLTVVHGISAKSEIITGATLLPDGGHAFTATCQ